jgi:hypothetical protein
VQGAGRPRADHEWHHAAARHQALLGACGYPLGEDRGGGICPHYPHRGGCLPRRAGRVLADAPPAQDGASGNVRSGQDARTECHSRSGRDDQPSVFCNPTTPSTGLASPGVPGMLSSAHKANAGQSTASRAASQRRPDQYAASGRGARANRIHISASAPIRFEQSCHFSSWQHTGQRTRLSDRGTLGMPCLSH